MSTIAPDPEAPTNVKDDSGPHLDDGFGTLIRKNLFKDIPNSIATIVFAGVLGYVLYKTFGFLFFNTKLSNTEGVVSGWRVIRDELSNYMVGTRFSQTGISFGQLWAAVYLAVFTIGLGVGGDGTVDDDVPPLSTGEKIAMTAPPVVALLIILNFTETFTPKLLGVLIIPAFLLGMYAPRVMPDALLRRKGQLMLVLLIAIVGLESNFAPTNFDSFGGLLLTINVAFFAIVLCFPIGVVMALIRRSDFVLLRPLAVAYIELIRGVPLITLLFMGQFALSFFLPPSWDPPADVLKAIFMFTIFSGAYVAEIVRGGLQAVPAGQTEAGQAVGLSPVTITRKIVLPQALRTSIPALVGQFIALLKDTTLLIIIGIFDLLGVSNPILQGPDYQGQGYRPEVYAFVAFMFWVMCFSMSRASQRLETRLGVGQR